MNNAEVTIPLKISPLMNFRYRLKSLVQGKGAVHAVFYLRHIQYWGSWR
jgi:hypothetical protein